MLVYAVTVDICNVCCCKWCSNVSEVQTVLKSDFLSKNREALSVLPWYDLLFVFIINVYFYIIRGQL